MLKKDLTGQEFGDWTVLKRDERVKCPVTYICRCKCGKEVPVRSSPLIQGNTTKCRQCANLSIRKGEWVGIVHVWHRTKRRAKQDGISFEITKKQIFDILLSQNHRCALSGVPIRVAESNEEWERSHATTTASIDRKDSSGGYTLENIQWVHKRVNVLKNDLSDTDLVFWCKLIVEHAASKSVA